MMKARPTTPSKRAAARGSSQREIPYLPTIEVCEGCRRTLLFGERSVRLTRNEEAMTVCVLCAAPLLDGGFRRAA